MFNTPEALLFQAMESDSDC